MTAVDSSGNDFHGTWKGNPQAFSTLLTDGPGGATLDGEADGVVISTGTLPSTPLSIEAWVKTGKWGTNLSLIAGQTHEIGGSNPQFIRDFVLFMDNDTGVANFTARIVGESNITVTGTTVLRDTGPHHVVGTIGTDRRLRLYVDGVQEGGTSAAATGTSLDSSGRLRIGRPPRTTRPAPATPTGCFRATSARSRSTTGRCPARRSSSTTPPGRPRGRGHDRRQSCPDLGPRRLAGR